MASIKVLLFIYLIPGLKLPSKFKLADVPSGQKKPGRQSFCSYFVKLVPYAQYFLGEHR